MPADAPPHAVTTTTGVPSLDVLLGGGLVRGDNVVLTGEAPGVGLALARAFVDADPERALWVALCPPPDGLSQAVEVLVAPPVTSSDLESCVATITDAASTRPRVVVDGLDAVCERLGPEPTTELYRLCCPRLFDQHAIACWPFAREVVGPSVAARIAGVAQVVLELRADAIRVAKAEGRSLQLQGALAELEPTGPDGRPLVGRDLVAGRLGEGLKRLRRARRLTQRDLAGMAGVTPAAISQAESGRRGLSLETLVQLCDALDTGLDDLLGTARSSGHVLARRDGRPDRAGTVALFDSPGEGSAAYRVELPPGGSGAPPFAHKGPELVLVGRGLVLVDLGDDTPVMRTGDALRVLADPIGGWANLGTEAAELFWLAEPQR